MNPNATHTTNYFLKRILDGKIDLSNGLPNGTITGSVHIEVSKVRGKACTFTINIADESKTPLAYWGPFTLDEGSSITFEDVKLSIDITLE